jgi:chromosome segregation ATPase
VDGSKSFQEELANLHNVFEQIGGGVERMEKLAEALTTEYEKLSSQIHTLSTLIRPDVFNDILNKANEIIQKAEELKKREKELAEREERLRGAEAELEARRKQREAELAQLDQQIRELQAARQMLEAEIAARKKELEKHKMDLLAAEIKRNYELYLALRDKEIRLLKWEADLQKRERACY